MVYKVQDGIEFATRAEWRKYMIDTYYSIKNKIDERHPIVKHSGSIGGQGFDIADCTNCRIVIMDNTEQVQVDNLRNCQVFIAACASTIFVRNCEDCTIYCCSRQLRLRECFNSAFYVFSMSEVHIELSKNVVFAPFMGGYSDHRRHLEAAGIQIDAPNMWNHIYDHNDFEKTNENWDLLPVHDRNLPWFPDGSSISCFPGASNGDAFSSRKITESGQVGESFGIEQMISDHNTSKMSALRESIAEDNPSITRKSKIEFDGLLTKSAGDGVKQLGVEVALLIAAATAKGIDVAIWLTDVPGLSVVSAADFNTKLTSLGLAVGIHESWEAKRELDLATSKSSLKTIFSLCGHFSTDSGSPLIDVSLFLRMALDRVNEHLRHIQLGDDASNDPSAPLITSTATAPSLISNSEKKTIRPQTSSPPKQEPPKQPSPSIASQSPMLGLPNPSNEPVVPVAARPQPIPKQVVALTAGRSASQADAGIPVGVPPTRTGSEEASEGVVSSHRELMSRAMQRMSLGDLGIQRGREMSSSRGRGRSTDANRRFSSSVAVYSSARSHSRDAAPRMSTTRVSLSGMGRTELESFLKATVQKTDFYHLIQVYIIIMRRTFVVLLK